MRATAPEAYQCEPIDPRATRRGKSPGPDKNFAPGDALELARDVFWQRGYDGTSIRTLESALGVGRKSLYDTFGSKRELYLRALDQYNETVIRRICVGLDDPRNSAIENLERVLDRLRKHHSSADGLGCLLGGAMAQADRSDEELAAFLRGSLEKLEAAFERALRQARADGAIHAEVQPRDAARNLVALTQGMALMGRVAGTTAVLKGVVRAALDALRP